MNDVRSILSAELAQLEAELRSDPRFRKIEHIKSLLSLYDVDGRPGPTQALAGLRKPAPMPVPVKKFRVLPVDTKKARIKDAVRSLLAEKGTSHRTMILDKLKEAGLMGYEKDPMASLAAYLSDWRTEFKADGRGNFSLANSSPQTNEAAGASPKEASPAASITGDTPSAGWGVPPFK